MSISRRQALVAGAATVGAGLGAGAHLDAQGRAVTKGRLKQSVCRWCYQKIALPDLAKAVADMGLTAIDLLGEADWAVVRDYGLICSMG